MSINKDLILVRGASGSGKSTIATLLSSDRMRHSYVISTDDFFMDLNGEYNFIPSLLSENHGKCMTKVEDIMKENGLTKEWSRIIVHNTFTEEWEMQHYQYLANKYNYKIHTIIVENRHKSENIHHVPKEVVEAQKERFSIVL